MKQHAKKNRKTKAKPASAHAFLDSGDRVLILRRCNPDGSSYNGFIWPKSGPVEAPDFNPEPVCGGGLHGWPWGMGIGEGQNYSFADDLWIVFAAKPEDIVGELDKGYKCKAAKGEVIYAGPYTGAWNLIRSGQQRYIEALAKSLPANASGNSSKSASSGDNSRSASSGNNSQSASSGDNSRSASSGDNSRSASSGNNSQSASSGNNSQSASSGNNSRSASSGNNSQSASSGNNSRSASSGNNSKSASSGNNSRSASSGNNSRSASSGNNSKSASSGDYSQSASSGDYSQSASSGDYSQSASSGDYSQSACGTNGFSCIAGIRGMVKGGLGSAISLGYEDKKGNNCIAWGQVGKKGIKENVWYFVKNGKLAAFKP